MQNSQERVDCNSIGFLRFLLATLVVFSHCYDLGGFGEEPLRSFTHAVYSFGELAVAGFFVLSGYLITQSYNNTQALGRFLWHRILRIFPAFWVCLIVTATIFGPLTYLITYSHVAGYLRWAPTGPIHYITANFFLQIQQWGIDGLLSSVPHPVAFDGSLWTLHNEFTCYCFVAVLGFMGARRWMALAIYLTLCTIHIVPGIIPLAVPSQLLPFFQQIGLLD